MAGIQKSPDAFRTISEVAEILDVPAHVLRFWESRFAQIKPVKRGGGRRYYRPADIDLLRGIRDLLYTDGLTIKGVQKILREKGQRHVAELGQLEPEADPVITGEPEPVEEVATKSEPVLEAAPEPEPKLVAAVAADPEPAPDRIAAAVAAAPARKPLEISPRRDGPTQVDQFAQSGRGTRRAFPPDPAQAARRAKLVALYGKLKTLRSRMAQGLE